MNSTLTNTSPANLSLTVGADRIHRFFPLLHHGVMVKARVGCTIRTILCNQFGLSPKYVEDRIKTVFLDGKTVDNMDLAIIKDGSTLALSAAMPGLVGATLRRGGPLASLRGEITHQKRQEVPTQGEGMVIVKLFNLLTSEMGPTFLKKGVYLRREALRDFLMGLPQGFWTGCQKARLDGQEVGLDHLLGMKSLAGHDLVMLRVDCDDG